MQVTVWIALILGISGLLYGWHKWEELREQREDEERKKKIKKKC